MTLISEKWTPLELGQERAMKGYVTQLSEVTEKNPRALADHLGFSHRLVADGYALLLLLGPVSRHDFSWKDTTRFSAGWVKERVYFKDKNRLSWSDEYVQRSDQDRFRFHQGDGYQGENSWESFLSEQERLLNIRGGSDRIVKILPLTRGMEGDYPNARKEGALQWELMVEKQFICIALLKDGGTIRKGEFDSSYVVGRCPTQKI